MNASNAHLFLPLVVALAEGKKLQFDESGIEGEVNWIDANELSFHHHPTFYRIKPEIKTAWYRVAEYYWNPTTKYVTTVFTDEMEREYQECKTFIRWLTERIPYEVSK